MNRRLSVLNMLAVAALAGSTELAPVSLNRAKSESGDKLRRTAYLNWYSPWFFDIRENARGGKK